MSGTGVTPAPIPMHRKTLFERMAEACAQPPGAGIMGEETRAREVLANTWELFGWGGRASDIHVGVLTHEDEKAIAAMLAFADEARLAERELQDWQDIATAPKDGTEFQAWVGDTQSRAGRSWWEPRCRINPDSEAFEIWGRVDYDHDDWDTYSHLEPTHWRPAHEAPAIRKPHP